MCDFYREAVAVIRIDRGDRTVRNSQNLRIGVRLDIRTAMGHVLIERNRVEQMLHRVRIGDSVCIPFDGFAEARRLRFPRGGFLLAVNGRHVGARGVRGFDAALTCGSLRFLRSSGRFFE